MWLNCMSHSGLRKVGYVNGLRDFFALPNNVEIHSITAAAFKPS